MVVSSVVHNAGLTNPDRQASPNVHSSPKETQVLEDCISFGEECISVNLISSKSSTILNKSASVAMIAMRFELFCDLTEMTYP